MTKSLEITVFGKVQGVGFRWFTKQLAEQYSIIGWIMNQDNGSVIIHAQSDDILMQRFLYDLSKGPGFFAHVDRIEQKTIDHFQANSFAIVS